MIVMSINIQLFKSCGVSCRCQYFIFKSLYECIVCSKDLLKKSRLIALDSIYCILRNSKVRVDLSPCFETASVTVNFDCAYFYL